MHTLTCRTKHSVHVCMPDQTNWPSLSTICYLQPSSTSFPSPAAPSSYQYVLIASDKNEIRGKIENRVTFSQIKKYKIKNKKFSLFDLGKLCTHEQEQTNKNVRCRKKDEKLLPIGSERLV